MWCLRYSKHSRWWRRLQNVFKTSCKDVFNTSSRPIQYVFETYCEDYYLPTDLPRSHFWEIYGQSTNFSRVNFFGYTEAFKTVFQNTLKWLLLQIKIFLLKLGVRKDVAVSVNKESMNKSSYNTLHKFWDQSPSPHYQCCLQVSETVSWHKLRSCYSSRMLQHWVGGRGLIYSCKVDHSKTFSRNWLGLNNSCEILSQNLKKSVI